LAEGYLVVMSTIPSKLIEPIEGKQQLIDYFRSGEKPREEWRIGTEHEKFLISKNNNKAIPYEGAAGIKQVLTKLQHYGWIGIEDAGNLIGLKRDQQVISLEPGGQLELSGAPFSNLHQTATELDNHLEELQPILEELGTYIYWQGFNDLTERSEMNWMPKQRYGIMRPYMASKGKLGHDMMLRTAAIQVNLDYLNEADMVQKFRVSQALTPFVVALFQNSSHDGYRSYRTRIWHDTDPDRSGLLDFVHEGGMGYERYVDYALDVPMYFVFRDGEYIDCAGASFKDFMQGKLQQCRGITPLMSDWADHLTTIFTEVRLKTFLEVRSGDAGPTKNIMAFAAFWVGILYDQAACDEIYGLIKSWSFKEINNLYYDVAKYGCRLEFKGKTMKDWVVVFQEMAKSGLKDRSLLNEYGLDESTYLASVSSVV
jgi:glutamate--cysteine ligase